MAKMKKADLEKIVERELPGRRIARKSEAAKDAPRPKPVSEARSPDLDTLRRKYLRRGRTQPASRQPRRPEVDDPRPTRADDDEIVAVEPKAPAHPWDRAARPKAVVISGRDKRIVGKQG